MLTIRLFGAVEIRAAAQLVPLRSNRERAVLAALAHDLGKAVSHDVLTQRVWDDEPPANALALLYSYVSRLRRAFRDAIEQTGSDGPAPEVTSGPRTYTLEADRTAVDWHRYLRAAARARTLAEAGDDRAALAAFDQAEALWHGEALAGLPGLWAQATRTRMAEQRLATTLHRYPIELRLGRFTDLVPELSRQLDQHPGNESLAGHLLIALYGAGRPGDALTTFQRVRHHLLNELGTDPGPQLTHLHDRILNQAPVAELLPDRQPAPRGTSHRSTALSNLPGMSHLIGRDDVLAQVAEADRQRARIQVLSGMPGVGKTELALHAADRLQSRYPDGRIYLSLQGHSTPQSPPLPTHSALLFLLRTLGAPADSLHADTAELSTRWRTELAARRMVVILDDVASPEQVRPLLPDSPSSTALLTSRHRLTELSGAHTHFLDLLPEAESIALFRHLVGQERTDDIAQVGDIVARLGQLPLALAIGAARLKGRPTWTLERLARRLAREPGRLGEIRDEFRDVARVFEMSYLALSGDQRSGFRRLGLHPGPDFGSFEAEALIGRPGGQSERIIESLLNCHLLQEISPERYRFHDLLGEYARTLAQREEPTGEREAAVRRLVLTCIRLADQADRILYPGRPRLPVTGIEGTDPHWTDEADPHHWLTESCAALVATELQARGAGLMVEAAQLSHVLAEFLRQEGHWVAAAEMHHASSAHWRTVGNRRAEGRSRIDLSVSYSNTSRNSLAGEAGERALALTRAARDPEGEAEALTQLARLHLRTGEYETALDLQRKALTLPINRANRIRYSNGHGIILLHLSEPAEALVAFFEALSEARRSGDIRKEGQALNNIGNVYLEMGDQQSARRTFEESLTLSRISGTDSDRAMIRINLAETLPLPEELLTAVRLCQAGLETFRQLDDRQHVVKTLNILGGTYLRADRPRDAVDRFTEAAQVAHEVGAVHEEIIALRGAGRAETALGHLRQATQHLGAAVTLARATRLPGAEAEAADSLAAALLRFGRPSEAQAMWQRAVALGSSLDLGESDYLRACLRPIQ